MTYTDILYHIRIHDTEYSVHRMHTHCALVHTFLPQKSTATSTTVDLVLRIELFYDVVYCSLRTRYSRVGLKIT